MCIPEQKPYEHWTNFAFDREQLPQEAFKIFLQLGQYLTGSISLYERKVVSSDHLVSFNMPLGWNDINLPAQKSLISCILKLENELASAPRIDEFYT